MKAFLSHSASDAEFVQAVAEELGRQYVWLDEHVFETGDDFVAGMEAGVGETVVFVLFANRVALESINVQFEISEARRQIIAKLVERAMVFITEPSVTYRDLPSWLQRSKVSEARAPKPVARLIREALELVMRSRQRSLFIGRSRERELVETRLFPTDGSTAPRALVLSGLPGIGRRSLLERIARDHWNLRPTVQIQVESGDGLNDIATKLADRFEPYNTIAAFKRIAHQISVEDDAQLRSRIESYLVLSLTNHELPVLLDLGGLFDNEGHPTEVARTILSLLRASAGLYLAFVAGRRPFLPDSPNPIPIVSINSLSTSETRQLVSALSLRDHVTLSSDQVLALAESCAGYPPSAYHSVELVRDYGIDVALADKERLTASRRLPLIRYLRAVELDAIEQEILKILAAISPLPMAVLGDVLNASPERIAPIIGKLIDASLIVPDELGFHWLAQPMRDIIIRELKDLEKNTYARIADSIEQYLQSSDEEIPKLEIARSLFRAHSMADDEVHRDAAFSLATDLISTAEKLFYRREYRRSAEFARAAVDARPRNYDARYILSRALIKLGEFERATAEIDKLRQMNFLRETAFLQGLLERHRGSSTAAIAAYETALERGYKGLAIHRELAQCYLDLDDLRQARYHADQATRHGADNQYMIDLQIQIALRERDEKTALEKLALLKVVDRPEFFYHRASTVHAAFGRNAEALEAAQNCLSEVTRPTFAMLSQLTVCEIRMNRLDEAAEHLGRLDKEHGHQHQDIRIGLRCQLEIARRRFKDALVLSDRLREKTKPVHLSLRRSALQGVLAGVLPDAVRAEYSREVEELNKKLGGRDYMLFSPIDDE